MNGTTIGTNQQFTLLCGSTVGGDVIFTPSVTSLADCANTCSTFHPRCDAVTFDGTTCSLLAGVSTGNVGQTTQSTNVNAALAVFPGVSSNCATLGTSSTAAGTTFSILCGNVINGNDLSQAHAETMEDCMSQCVSMSGCSAVTFDATYSNGFQNCYFKGTGDDTTFVNDSFDTAVIGAAVEAADPSSTTATAATTGTTATSAVAATPTPSTVTQTIVSLVTSVSDSISRTIVTTEVITIPLLSGSTVTPKATSATGTAGRAPARATATGTELGTSSTTAGMGMVVGTSSSQPLIDSTNTPTDSRAWIAAPVVGSVAAVMMVAVMFVLWGRRRRNKGLSSPISPSFLFSRFRGGGGGGLGGSSSTKDAGFRNLSSADSSTAPPPMQQRQQLQSFSRPQLSLGNNWRTGGKEDKNSERATTAGSSAAATVGSRRINMDEEKAFGIGGATMSRGGSSGNAKSVPLIIDTGMALRSGTSSRSNSRDKEYKDKPREKPRAKEAGSSSNAGKPVPSRDLTKPSSSSSSSYSSSAANNKDRNSSGSSHSDKSDRPPLRNSLNGLAQNRTTLDGIPIFLRE